MNQPLSQYFISAGHNSYLTGNQLTDPSGTSTIILVSEAVGGCGPWYNYVLPARAFETAAE
jgi:hypothetical protein